jgi:hypothetical protein
MLCLDLSLVKIGVWAGGYKCVVGSPMRMIYYDPDAECITVFFKFHQNLVPKENS